MATLIIFYFIATLLFGLWASSKIFRLKAIIERQNKTIEDDEKELFALKYEETRLPQKGDFISVLSEESWWLSWTGKVSKVLVNAEQGEYNVVFESCLDALGSPRQCCLITVSGNNLRDKRIVHFLTNHETTRFLKFTKY